MKAADGAFEARPGPGSPLPKAADCAFDNVSCRTLPSRYFGGGEVGGFGCLTRGGAGTAPIGGFFLFMTGGVVLVDAAAGLLDAATAWRCCIGAELVVAPLVTSQQRSRVTHRTHHSQRACWYVLVPVLGTGTGKAVLVPVLSTTTGTWYYSY